MPVQPHDQADAGCCVKRGAVRCLGYGVLRRPRSGRSAGRSTLIIMRLASLWFSLLEGRKLYAVP